MISGLLCGVCVVCFGNGDRRPVNGRGANEQRKTRVVKELKAFVQRSNPLDKGCLQALANSIPEQPWGDFDKQPQVPVKTHLVSIFGLTACLGLAACSPEPEKTSGDGLDPAALSALAQYSEAVVQNPGQPQAHYNLGVALARAGRHEEAEASYRRALELEPEYALSYQGLGQLAFRRGAHEVAASYFRRAVAVDSTLAVAHNNLGHIHHRRGDIELAVRHYEGAVRHEPGQAQYLLNLGLAYRALGRFGHALAMVERAASLDTTLQNLDAILASLYLADRRLPEALSAYRDMAARNAGVDAHMGLGDVYATMSDLEQSAAQYRKVLELEPENPEAHHKLARVLDYQGNLPEAIRLLEEAVRLDETSVPALQSLAVLYGKGSRHEDGEILLSKARALDGENVETLLLLGELYTRQGRYEEAESALVAARDREPSRGECWRLLGLLYNDWGRGQDAENALRKAVELEPTAAQTHFNLASALRSLGKGAAADSSMRRFGMLRRVSEEIAERKGTLHQTPGDIERRLNLAGHHLMLGQREQALVQYQAVLALDPSHVEARVALVRMYVEQGQPSAGLKLCLEGIERYPEHPQLDRLYFAAGQVYFTGGRTSEAEAAWKRALELDPRYDEVHFVLGTLYESTGRGDLAEDAYRSFLERWDSDSPKAAAARAGLERLASR